MEDPVESLETKAFEPDNWPGLQKEHPLVKDFFGIDHDIQALKSKIMSADWNAKGDGERLANVREILGSPDLKHTLRERYDTAESVLSALNALLFEDLPGDSPTDIQGFLKERLDDAIHRYGLRVTELAPEKKIDHDLKLTLGEK